MTDQPPTPPRGLPEPRPLTRRVLLQGALAGAGAALLGGCTSSPSAPVPGSGSPTPTPSPAPTTTASGTGAPRWADLQARMSGRLFLPATPGYDAARLSANPRYDGLRPAAVAHCAGPADVAAAVAFARDSGVPFSVRAGGHSYTGVSTGASLVIDVSALNQVVVDRGAGLVRVGAGARLVDVYTAVAAAGRAVAAGSCPTVGATGLTVGGGVGVLTRGWGLTCDQLASYEMVTADGAPVAVDAATQPDLFWAGQGGAGGSFGAVTSLTLRTRPAPDLTVFALHWPWSAAADVVQAWQHWGPSTDSRCWTTCKVHAAPGQEPAVLVAGVWDGPDSALAAVLAPLLAAVGAGTTSRASRRHTYLSAMLAEAGCSGAGCHLPPAGTDVREALAATSHVPDGLMDRAGVQVLVERVAAAAGTPGLRLVTASLDALGGVVAQRAPDATAFVHRRAPYTVQYTATWADDRLPGSRFDAVVRGLRAAMTPYLGTGAYVNYCDASLAGWAQAYWGTNYPRLQEVKRAVDPHGLFTGLQTVQL